MSSDVVRTLGPVVAVLEQLGVTYRVGGSVATSALGVPRSTLDVDIACALRAEHVDAFVHALADAYYVDADMIRDAISRRASFNLVMLETMLKVDVFISPADAYDREAFARSVRMALEPDSREFDLATAEDMILRKLDWYRKGGGISERQWTDVIGVLRVQAAALDFAYLEKWADLLDLGILLARVRVEAARA
ncbi:MAG: hypothetical protein ACRENE_08370 [Polyangiaceae bacterium]